LAADDEYGTLRGQIEQLKTSLEHAQMLRRRKIEYDAVADRVSAFPSREELEKCVANSRLFISQSQGYTRPRKRHGCHSF
jgi:Zn-finger nucleic acid-binding protein